MKVGDKVRIQQLRAGGAVDVHGYGVVAAVNKTSIALKDGTRWRLDGHAWGSRPERGLGRSFQEQIVPAQEMQQ